MNYEEILPSSVLHWNYRGLTEFPIKQLKGEESAITDLYLKENLISKVPNDIGMLVHLESLYISGNDISELPKEISNLKCLKCLDVSGNRLKRIPSEIGEVGSLKFLILDENELTELPLRLSELRFLRYLSVCGESLGILGINSPISTLVNTFDDLKILRITAVVKVFSATYKVMTNKTREAYNNPRTQNIALTKNIDNKLRWLPQRPVYNYHHCELRFWRNHQLKSLPYSLWYHMFRDQQTRSLNIACLNITNTGNAYGRRCRLKLSQDSKEWELDVDCPPQYTNVLEYGSNSPPSLLELSKRTFYQRLSKAAKIMSTVYHSIYSDARKYCYNYDNNNLANMQNNFDRFNIKNEDTEFSRKKDCYYVPGDIIREHFNFLPRFVKEDLVNGPVSRCENASCKEPVFDYVHYEFTIGRLILIDSVQEVILNAVFCSKNCADSWKVGSVTTVPWSVIEI